MELPDENADCGTESAEMEQPSSEPGATMNDMLRQLRARRYQQGGELADSLAESEGEDPSRAAPSNDARSGDAGSVAAGTVAASNLKESGGEGSNLAGFDEMGQEIRRMGRELFKTNRVAERNQDLFTEALDEIRQLSSVIAQIPAQNSESLKEARFEAKAEICRELLRMADTIQASLAAADDLLERLEQKASQEAHGMISLFASARQLRESLRESVSALRQWRNGQQLLTERLSAILQTAGVRAIASEGSAFDPAQHRAVSTERRSDVASGIIVAEELKGYILDGKILRYAEVVVAKNE